MLIYTITLGLPVRFGSVAVSTPPAVVEDERALRHTSFVADQIETEDVSDTGGQAQNTQRITSQGSLVPPVPSAARSSYMTTTTDGSRMSGLSDFPEPPPVEHLTPAHMSIIHSYFEGNAHAQTDPPTEEPPTEDPPPNNQTEHRRHASHRMTFGGSEDIESVGEVAPASPDM
jgi:serine/arginine repetitive matrix protein 2